MPGTPDQIYVLPRRRVRAEWGRASRFVGLGALSVGVLVATFALLSPARRPEALGTTTVVIGDWVPTWWELVVPIVAFGLIALAVASRFDSPDPRSHRFVRKLGVVALVVGALGGAVVVGLQTFTASYAVLSEASDGGCRVVVREHSFLFSGSGDVGVVHPGSLTVVWVGAYSADDGYRPFTQGTYSLDWRDRSARFEVWGTPTQPTTWTQGQEPDVRCDR